ncbi:hypothetical protein DFH09DRAFT_214876 [Mycena vulgaris]|nr:hypothetical protein DFH09DRAFT_214876 [Mycena vulgaris]
MTSDLRIYARLLWKLWTRLWTCSGCHSSCQTRRLGPHSCFAKPVHGRKRLASCLPPPSGSCSPKRRLPSPELQPRPGMSVLPINAPHSTFQFGPPPFSMTATDPYFGHEYIAQLSARFISHLFACPEWPQEPLLPASYRYAIPPRKPLPIRYRQPLPALLQSIYRGYKAGDAWALRHAISLETPENIARLTSFFERYGVPRIPLISTEHEICAAGMSGIQRIVMDLDRLGLNIGLNQLVLFGDLAQEVEDLKASCRKLHYLLRTGRSSRAVRDRIEALVEKIEICPAMNLDLLQGLDDFAELYLNFCEASLASWNTRETIRDLRKLVEAESAKANERVDKFDRIMQSYTERGRQDLAALMQENVKASRKAGFREGVSTAAESQQICDELEKIDKSLASD